MFTSFPAEIWRFDEEQVTKVFVKDKKVTNIVLDPNLKTADTNTADNVFVSAVFRFGSSTMLVTFLTFFLTFHLFDFQVEFLTFSRDFTIFFLIFLLFLTFLLDFQVDFLTFFLTF